MATRRFIELSLPEIEAAFERRPLVLLPVGSVEQHGPHLPTGTDFYASEGIADAVAERLDALVLPFSPIGVTPMHMPYVATLTVSPDVFRQLVVEVVGSAVQHGAREVVIINWHEGNIPSLSLAAETLHRGYGCSVVVVHACYVAEDLYGERAGGLTHGGEIEALAVLATRPELVHLERVSGSSDVPRGAHADRLRRTRAYQPILTDIRDIAPTGWYGDPSKADATQAQTFLATVADAVAERVTVLLDELGKLGASTSQPSDSETGGHDASLLTD